MIKVSEFEYRWGQEFSVLHVIQTGSGAHPASYQMGIGDSFPGSKAAGGEANHSLQLVPRSRKCGTYTSTPPYTFMM
jgi:hypothetical protein